MLAFHDTLSLSVKRNFRIVLMFKLTSFFPPKRHSCTQASYMYMYVKIFHYQQWTRLFRTDTIFSPIKSLVPVLQIPRVFRTTTQAKKLLRFQLIQLYRFGKLSCLCTPNSRTEGKKFLRWRRLQSNSLQSRMTAKNWPNKMGDSSWQGKMEAGWRRCVHPRCHAHI